MRTTEQASIRKTRKFLENLGLTYDKISPATQKYILDMSLKEENNPEVLASSIIGMKFNNKVNTNMSGGRVSLPIEYFGTPTDNYVENPMIQDTSVGTELVRAGLSETPVLQTGGGKSSRFGNFLDYSDYKKLQAQYENKFMRKLTLKPYQKKALIDSLNNDIETAVIKAVKDNNHGRLTKTGLSKSLKSVL
jgi:hypothetical protein